MIAAPETAIAPMPAGRYFADYSAWSQSMLKTFMDRRRLAQAYYIDRSATEPPPTDPMRKGTATHTAILEPDRFEELVITYPEDYLDARGYVTTKIAKEFRDQHQAAGRVVLKEAEAAQVRAMADSVRRVCGKWLEKPGRKEQSVYWTDEITGLRCKARLDWLLERKTPIVLDLKTTADSSPVKFRNRVEDGGYWLQASHYAEGVKHVMGVEAVEFYFIVVETEFPYSCALYSLDHPATVAANLARRRVLNDLTGCLASGDFAEPWELGITALPLRSRCYETNQL